MDRRPKNLAYCLIMDPLITRRRWDEARDHRVAFALYSHGWAEKMPPGRIEQRQGIDDWLWVCFHDPVRVRRERREQEVPGLGIGVWRPSEYRNYGNDGAEWTHSWVQMTGTRVESLLASVGMVPGRVWKGADLGEVERMWRLLHVEALRAQPDERILGNEFENGLRRLERRRREDPAPAEARLDVLRAWLEVETDRRIGLEEMARRAGMSRSHFCACFQERFGVPPAEYHLQRRVEVARYLLTQRGLRVAEAGAAVGCPDPATFSRMFKRVVGVPPRSAKGRGQGHPSFKD
jgi:AraC-like DNA-binding protein